MNFVQFASAVKSAQLLSQHHMLSCNLYRAGKKSSKISPLSVDKLGLKSLGILKRSLGNLETQIFSFLTTNELVLGPPIQSCLLGEVFSRDSQALSHMLLSD